VAQILERHNQLSFRLQQQRLIELIRRGAVDEALHFAQETVGPLCEDNPGFLSELERTLTLLAFENGAASPVASLLEPAQRARTAAELNAALQSSSQDEQARLPLLLQSLAWSEAALSERAAFPRLSLPGGSLSEPR